MPRVFRTLESRRDYDEIWSYVAAHDPNAADRLVDRFDNILSTLVGSPQMGRKVEELAAGLRSFPVGSYLIFYRAVEHGIQLIRIVHGARDITPEYFDLG